MVKRHHKYTMLTCTLLKKSSFSDKNHEPNAGEIYIDIPKTEKSEADKGKIGDYDVENIVFTACRLT